MPEQARHRKWLRITLAGVALLALLGTTSVTLMGDTPTDAVDRTGARGPSRAAVPSGWRPWHNALESGGDDPVPFGPSCTTDALGVFCSSPRIALTPLSPATGRVDWTKPMSRKEVSGFSVSEPVVHDGVVYVDSADRAQGVDAFDGRTGAKLWHLDGPVGTFAELGGVILVRLDELVRRQCAVRRLRAAHGCGVVAAHAVLRLS